MGGYRLAFLLFSLCISVLYAKDFYETTDNNATKSIAIVQTSKSNETTKSSAGDEEDEQRTPVVIEDNSGLSKDEIRKRAREIDKKSFYAKL